MGLIGNIHSLLFFSFKLTPQKHLTPQKYIPPQKCLTLQKFLTLQGLLILIGKKHLLKSMSKVVTRIARIAIISSFYIEFVLSQLESILVSKK